MRIVATRSGGLGEGGGNEKDRERRNIEHRRSIADQRPGVAHPRLPVADRREWVWVKLGELRQREKGTETKR